MSTEKVTLSHDLHLILQELNRKTRAFAYDITRELVSVYCELETGQPPASWAALKAVKFHRNGIKIMLRRYQPEDSTVPALLPEPPTPNKANQVWVMARDVDHAVAVLLAHRDDLKKRITTGRKHGVQVLDKRTYRAGRGNRASAHK